MITLANRSHFDSQLFFSVITLPSHSILYLHIFISQSTKQRTEAWGHLQGIKTTASHRASSGPSDRAGLCFVPWKEAIASKSFQSLFVCVCVCLSKASMNPIEHERSTLTHHWPGLYWGNHCLQPVPWHKEPKKKAYYFSNSLTHAVIMISDSLKDSLPSHCCTIYRTYYNVFSHIELKIKCF